MPNASKMTLPMNWAICAIMASDPPSRIDWKRFAATRETMVREHGFDAQGEIVLRQPQGDFEAGLQYLSGGLRMAERLGRTGAYDAKWC